jgi:hypothetical protein
MRSARSFVSASLVCTLFAAVTPAFAQPRGRYGLTPHRPVYIGGGLGFSAGLNGEPALFKLQEEVGYQFAPIPVSGNVDLILRIGGDFTQQFTGGLSLLQFGARVTPAFGVWRNTDVTVRVAPSLMLGGATAVERTCDRFTATCRDTSRGFVNVQFAVQGEVELLDGGLSIWFRPLAFDGYASDRGFARWDFLAGVDGHF